MKTDEATAPSPSKGVWWLLALAGFFAFALGVWLFWPTGEKPKHKAKVTNDGGAQLKVEAMPSSPPVELKWEEDKPNAAEKKEGWTHLYYLTTNIDKDPVTMWVFVGDNKGARKVKVTVTSGQERWWAHDEAGYPVSVANKDCSLEALFKEARKRPGLPPAISGQLDKLSCELKHLPPP